MRYLLEGKPLILDSGPAFGKSVLIVSFGCFTSLGGRRELIPKGGDLY